MKNIYLAGPISGQTYKEATEWRNEVRATLTDLGIKVYSPMRHKEYLQNENDLTFKDFGQVLSTSKAIMARDYQDASRCDLLLVNFNVPHPQLSAGTIMEIAWAYANHTPVVLVDHPKFNYARHPMIKEAISVLAKDLVQAVEVVKHFLLEG